MSQEARDEAVIGECLRAAVDGPSFEDWEFGTLFGFQREEIRLIGASWPVWDDTDEQAEAINATLNNLLGYPHGLEREWSNWIPADEGAVRSLYQRWREDGRRGG